MPDTVTEKMYEHGYTTGVYDMFHIGHLNVLENAKKHCKRLTVGVSTDELVLEYKHKKTIIPFEERIRIVSAIRCVDEAVPQTDMNKLDNLLRYSCDAIFVGDDWKGTEKWNAYERQFAEYGISVVYLPYTQGTSSTKLAAVLEEKLGSR